MLSYEVNEACFGLQQARLKSGLGNYNSFRGLFPVAVKYYFEAVELFEKYPGSEDTKTLHSNIGCLLAFTLLVYSLYQTDFCLS